MFTSLENKKKVKSAPLVIGRAKGSSVPALTSGFCSMKPLGVFLFLENAEA